jgi:hypothetical protein
LLVGLWLCAWFLVLLMSFRLIVVLLVGVSLLLLFVALVGRLLL